FGRHFRLDPKTKVIVGRSQQDNKNLIQYLNKDKDILLKHASLPGPDVILTGDASKLNIETAAMILAGYTKSKPGKKADIKVIKQQNETIIHVTTIKSSEFRHLMI
ncbi:MAG: tRNA 4-thiouridine(8) synthase ThiI, partial [Desulfobacula sp.]|nr:tRNA 4-thiouridine(8) synthase ThiI [Desulfobacula sp.]